MRPLLALLLAAGLALPAIAQEGKPATPAKPPAPAAAAQPETPHSIPVPDGPVVNKQELEGGLIIEDMKIGDGTECKPNQIIVAYYHGTLKADPSVIFDSAFNRGEPATFSLDPSHPTLRVIQGWQKGIPGMKVGGVRRITIPAAMAYGSQSRGPQIPAKSDLVFVIQLEGVLSLDDVKVEDIKVGEGEAADSSCVAVTTQIFRDDKGKEIASNDAAHPYIWLPGEMAIQALGEDVMQHALKGMKVGGKRKITIPKSLNVAPPQLQCNRPTNVPVTVEVELVAVRNLPQQGRR